MKKKKKTESSY